MKNVATIMECSRIFSLPMTIQSWLVIFVFSLIDSGNILYGILALLGICFAHLGANIFDDYIDYKSLIKQVNFDKNEYLKNSQKTKCRYIICGKLKETDVLGIAISYFAIATFIGLFLFLKCGMGVVQFAFIGGIIALIYPIASRFCLSEVLIGLAFGPVLFGGVYYVMTGTYTSEVFWLSLPIMFITVVLLYIHSVMDFDFDLNEGKKTIANLFNSQLDSLVVLKVLLVLAYISLIFLCVFDILDWQVFLVYLTIPLAKDLYNSLVEFSTNSEHVPDKKWFHFPMENLEKLKENNEASFMIRMYQSRNLAIYFSLFLTVAIILSKAV